MERHHIKFYHHLFTLSQWFHWTLVDESKDDINSTENCYEANAHCWSMELVETWESEQKYCEKTRRNRLLFDLTMSVEIRFMGPKILFTDEGGKVVWWQGCLGQKSECSRPGAAGWWRRPSSTTRWSAWTSSWRTARGNRSEDRNVVSMLCGDELWVVLVVREVTRPQNIYSRLSV